jgi:hypothetical protein
VACAKKKTTAISAAPTAANTGANQLSFKNGQSKDGDSAVEEGEVTVGKVAANDGGEVMNVVGVTAAAGVRATMAEDGGF